MTSLAIPSPILWTPRPWWGLPQRPSWRAPIEHLLHLKRRTTGHLIKNAAGHLVKQCAASGTFCGGACVARPVSLTAAFSGIVCVAGCCPGGSSTKKMTISSFSGTYTIPFVSDDGTQCNFSGTFSGSGGELYAASSCSGGVIETADTLNMGTTVLKSGGVSYITGMSVNLVGPSSGFFNLFFDGGLTVITDCTSNVTLTNQNSNTGFNCNSHGGTCVISFNY